ncbi:hypothetical protein ACLKA6_005204 [Drosophila palustris]
MINTFIAAVCCRSEQCDNRCDDHRMMLQEENEEDEFHLRTDGELKNRTGSRSGSGATTHAAVDRFWLPRRSVSPIDLASASLRMEMMMDNNDATTGSPSRRRQQPTKRLLAKSIPASLFQL